MIPPLRVEGRPAEPIDVINGKGVHPFLMAKNTWLTGVNKTPINGVITLQITSRGSPLTLKGFNVINKFQQNCFCLGGRLDFQC